MRAYVLWVLILSGLCGCANHPLQDDVTGYDTADILRKVRCEAQEQILIELRRRGLRALYNDVLEVKRELKVGSEWEANNKSILSKIDKTISDDNKEGKSLASKRDTLKREYSKVAQHVSALNELLRTESSADAKRALIIRHREAFARGMVISKRIDEVNNELQKVISRQNDNRIKHDEILEKIWFGPDKGTEEEYLKYKKNRKKLKKEYDSADVDQKSRRKLFQISNTTLAMKLDFKVTENNNGTADGTITWPIHLGSVSLVYNAGKEKGRESQRLVNTVSLFEELSNENKLKCTNDNELWHGERAQIYPIIGQIGVGDFIEQYLKISEKTTIPTGKDTFTDTLTFTTKISGKLNPTIEVKPVSPSLVKAGLDINSDRTDLHVVTLQIRPYAPPTPKSKGTKIFVTEIPELSIKFREGPDGGPPRIDAAH